MLLVRFLVRCSQRENGKDCDKIDYVIILKVKKDVLADKKRVVPGRDKAYIIHKDHLTEIDGFHYLER